jgi:antitoxin component YwqK of YwqJK toxin-antitoxin module
VSLLFICCGTKSKKVIKRYPDGKVLSVIDYPNKYDSTSCKISVYYHNGAKGKELIMQNGKYIDRKVTYHVNGVIEQIDSLSEPCDTSLDECNGKLIRYYKNGNILQRYMVQNGAHNGLTQQYNINGILIKTYILKHDSVKNGEYKEFHNNGKVAYMATYKNDTIVGYQYFFNEKGDTIKYYQTFNGQMDFPYKKWLPNGLIIIGDYTNNIEKSVTWKWFDKTGKEVKRKIAYPTKDGFTSPE